MQPGKPETVQEKAVRLAQQAGAAYPAAVAAVLRAIYRPQVALTIDCPSIGPGLFIEHGYATFPVYLRRIHGAILTNVGNAFYGDLTDHGWRVGVGAELRLDFKLGYYYESLLQFGVAKGLSTGGITDYYWVTSFPIF